MHRRPLILPLSVVTVCLSSIVSLSCGGDSGGAKCDPAVAAYTASVTAAPSFATDIYPILSNTVAAKGCGQMTICHGTPAIMLDPTGIKHLSFTDPAPTVKAALLASSVNAPTMMNVVPSSIATSFLAYKISGLDGLACVTSMCTKGATVGKMTACGDPMPSAGVLSAADRIKILDWIALGAAD